MKNSMIANFCSVQTLIYVALSIPVYTKRQRQRCDNSAMTLAILLSLKSMETLENRLQPHSGVSLQSCRSIDVWRLVWMSL